METMQEFIDRASKAYYEGSPIISDASYDILTATYRDMGVGYHIKSGMPHFYKMFSLQKCYDLSKAPLDLADCYVTPKLDGLAISLLYIEGKLELGLTRGDGNLGHDITEKVRHLVPNTVRNLGKIVQVTGEVVAHKSVKNSRNFAAGTMNLKDIEEFKSRIREVHFIAYSMEPNSPDDYESTLQILRVNGFRTVDEKEFCSQFPTDGLVYRHKSNRIFESLGYTSHHPRGAFAYKEQSPPQVTKLLDVLWQVGRSGVISPVAILEPVDINGATVSRASLHNIGFIKKLGLEIGCDVEVIRSGEIIPHILGRVD